MELLIFLVITNFLRTLFIIVIVYYGFKLFARYILPSLVDKGVRNLHNKMQEQQRQQQRSGRQQGDVTIENKNKTGNQNSQIKGDYVDFEEVE